MKDNKYTEDIDFSSLLVDEKTYGKIFSKNLFDAYDYGPESHRIINGKICVYYTEGSWISEDGVELNER